MARESVPTSFHEAGLVDVGFFRGNSRKQIMIHR